MKVAVFDLETWDLVPEFGPILCASVLSGEEMTSFRQDSYLRRKLAEDMTDDRQLCLDVRDFLEEHHITVGWFSKGFDLTHLRTRLILHGERPLKQMLHMDPCFAYRGWRGARPKSSKLKHVAEFYGFEEKPEVGAEVWLKARGGNKKAMDVVQNRCEADVRITAEIAAKTLENGLMKNITFY